MLRGYVSGSCKVNADPKKDAAIRSAASNDAKSYIDFMKKYSSLLDDVEEAMPVQPQS
jgi:hypothetical protein